MKTSTISKFKIELFRNLKWIVGRTSVGRDSASKLKQIRHWAFSFPAFAGMTVLWLLPILSMAQVPRVLIFHKVNGFAHVETEVSIDAFLEYATGTMDFSTTIDSLMFNTDTLNNYDAVVFINTNYRNGRLLNDEQEAAFEAYIQNGGGFVGIHSSIPLPGAWEETVWPWFAELFGARFISHPAFQLGEMMLEDTTHISTRGIPTTIALSDEWYALVENPRTKVNVLASQIGSSMTPVVTEDRPVSWYHAFDGGRSWVTLVGHDLEAFENQDFLAHVHGGILYASDIIPGCTDSTYLEYDSLATASDGSCQTLSVGPQKVPYGQLQVFQTSGASLVINFGIPDAYLLEVFTMEGKKILHQAAPGGHPIHVRNPVSRGLVVLKLTSATSRQVKKLLLLP